MDQSQPANSRALASDDPTWRDEDEIGALLRHAFVETRSESVAIERWNGLAERVVADLQKQLDQERMEVQRSEICRVSLVLGSWSSLTVRLA